MQQLRKIHLPSILQLIISSLGITILITTATGLLLMGFIAIVQNQYSNAEIFLYFSTACTTIFFALLLIPSLIYPFMRLINRQDKLPKPNQKLVNLPKYLIILWPLFLFLGEIVSGEGALAWIFLPPIQIVVIGLPIWYFLEIGCKQLQGGSPQRNWGLLSFGLVITPAVAMIVEILIVGVLVVLVSFWIMTQPDLVEEFTRLSQRLAYAEMDPETLERIVTPYLQKPIVLFSIAAMIAGIVPLIEELVKPLAIWGLAGRKLTPAEGFKAGLISGSAFALLESLSMLATVADEGWAVIAIGRLGTGLLHMTTTALVGWGLAVAWQDRQYLKLGIIYLVAVSIHALWNLFSLMMGLNVLMPAGTQSAASWLLNLAHISPAILGILVFFIFMILIGSNRILRRNKSLPEISIQSPAQ